MGVLNIHIHPIWESTVAQASRHWQCLKVEIPFAKLQPAFPLQPCVGHRVGFEPRGSQEHSWAAPSVRVLIQGKRELESTPLSPAGVGAWGVVAYANFRAWYGFHLLSRNLQNLVWNVSVHLQTALAEDGESCLLHVPHPAPLGLQSRPKVTTPAPCKSSGSLLTFGQPCHHFFLLVLSGSGDWSWDFCSCPSACHCGRGQGFAC